MTDQMIGRKGRKILGFLALLQPGSRPLPHSSFSRAIPGVGRLIEQAVEPLKIGLTLDNFTMEEALKYVEGQKNFEELCETMREVQDNVMDLLSEEN